MTWPVVLLRPLLGLCALTAAAVEPALARASEPPSLVSAGAASSEADEARQRFREASAAAERGHWQKALELYRSAYALFPHATTLYNIGYCHAQLGESTRALYYTARALDSEVFDGDRQLALEHEARARALVAMLLEQIGSVTISIDSQLPFSLTVDGAASVPTGTGDGSFVPSPDASVTSDDRAFLERVTLRLDPGVHEIAIDSGGRTYVRSIEVIAGHAVSINWLLDTDAAASATAPVAPAATAPARLPVTAAPAIADNKAQRALATAPAEGSSVYRPLAISSFVVGGAGLGLGLISGVVALTTHNHLEAVCTDGGACSEAEAEAVNRYQTAALLTNVGLWTGLGGGVLGIGFLLLDRADDGREVSLAVDPSGVELRGTF